MNILDYKNLRVISKESRKALALKGRDIEDVLNDYNISIDYSNSAEGVLKKDQSLIFIFNSKTEPKELEYKSFQLLALAILSLKFKINDEIFDKIENNTFCSLNDKLKQAKALGVMLLISDSIFYDAIKHDIEPGYLVGEYGYSEEAVRDRFKLYKLYENKR